MLAHICMIHEMMMMAMESIEEQMSDPEILTGVGYRYRLMNPLPMIN